MEVAKNWVLLAAVIAVIALGAKVSQQAGTIGRLLQGTRAMLGRASGLQSGWLSASITS